MNHSAVIAGTHSSAGKTTWALALMAFFRKKGLTVQPFKVGPDYIDPGFHNQVCAPRKSRNLDRFFLSEESLKQCFWKHSEDVDLALVEGVMGLYDGRSAVSEEGSTAEMAKLLGIPVFLVVDGKGLARSAAALVKGYRDFDPAIDLKGVLVNRIGSERHFKWLREAIEKETGVPVLGWLPKETSVLIPERHLGLRTAVEEDGIGAKLERLTNLLEGRFDWERFLAESSVGAQFIAPQNENEIKPKGVPTANGTSKCRIGVAYDRAFSFYYEDNFDLLREAGAELVFFSPLSDLALPEDLDALYFGGGFPELYAKILGENQSMKASIRKFHESGGILYSECGGLIYLAESFVDSEGQEFPLLGLIPGKIRLTSRLQRFGYHEVDCETDTFLFPRGKRLRSHEFHYSIWEAEEKNLPRPYRVQGRSDGFYDGRILASYQHLHFGQNPELAWNFVRAASAYSEGRKLCNAR